MVTGALALHGLLPVALEAASLEPAIEVPAGIRRPWETVYSQQKERNSSVTEELREISSTLRIAGVEGLFLKGSAAVLTVYQDLALRELKDLDLLVRPEDAARATACLQALGYRRRPEWNAAEFEQARLQAGEGSPLERNGRFLIELHVTLEQGVPVPELFGAAQVLESDGVRILCPSVEHFVIHTALHYSKHLDLNFASLKGLVDIALALHKYDRQLDWSEFWSTTRAWGVEEQVAVVLATIRHHWELDISGLPEGVEPLSSEILLYGRDDVVERQRAYLPRVYRERLQRLRTLPGAGARCRYLFRLLFPEPENMRHRYGVPEGRPLLGAYLRHPFTLAGRLAAGLGALAWRRARDLGKRR